MEHIPVRVYIEFINADMDGQLLDSDSGPSVVRNFVKAIYSTTDSGQIGKTIASIPFSKLIEHLQGGPIDDQYVTGAGMNPGGVRHNYTIVTRMQEGDEVWLQVRHSVRELDKFDVASATDAPPASE